MEDTRYYYVKNWWKYQHYRDRTPPWIKVHRRVLSNEAFLSLSPSDRWYLIRLWIDASEHDGTIPARSGYVRATCGLGSDYQASCLLARLEGKHLISLKDVRGAHRVVASVETERETETYKQETEKEKPFAPSRQKTPDAEPPIWQGQILTVTGKTHTALQAAYPVLNLTDEYARADAWLVNNPARRKKDLKRFLNNWLARSQEKNDFREIRRNGHGRQFDFNADLEGLVEDFDRKRAQKSQGS